MLKSDLEGSGDGVLSRVGETSDDYRETLLGSRGVRVSEDLDDTVVREPVGDGLKGKPLGLKLSH